MLKFAFTTNYTYRNFLSFATKYKVPQHTFMPLTVAI